MTVELVLLTPAVFLIALAVLAFGRVTESHQLVVEASRAGAEAAAVEPNAASAEAGAAESAVVGIFDRAHTCSQAWVNTDTSHFYPGWLGQGDGCLPGEPLRSVSAGFAGARRPWSRRRPLRSIPYRSVT